MLRERRQYFERPVEAMTALWWVPAGHRPTVAQAQERLVSLREHGPTPFAFTLRETFPAPGATEGDVVVRDLEHFSRFLLDRLLNQAGVDDVNSSFVLRTVKAFRGLPLPR